MTLQIVDARGVTVEVSELVFRSYLGERKVNGGRYYGPVYAPRSDIALCAVCHQPNGEFHNIPVVAPVHRFKRFVASR